MQKKEKNQNRKFFTIQAETVVETPCVKKVAWKVVFNKITVNIILLFSILIPSHFISF